MGNKIAEARKKKSISQEELAKKSGISRATISGLESGRITITTTDTLKKIVDALGEKVGDIFLQIKFNKLNLNAILLSKDISIYLR